MKAHIRLAAPTTNHNEHLQHTSSAVFAVPPGVKPGGWIGETRFA